jgi:hypothetical protein
VWARVELFEALCQLAHISPSGAFFTASSTDTFAEVCSSSERLCYNCKQPGHESNGCPHPRTTESTSSFIIPPSDHWTLVVPFVAPASRVHAPRAPTLAELRAAEAPNESHTAQWIDTQLALGSNPSRGRCFTLFLHAIRG